MPDSFLTDTKSLEAKIREYLRQPYFSHKANPELIREGFLLYPSRSSKLIRPLILCCACGAVGGNPNSVIPAAAAVELFHTWTLMHDDIIDNDDLRRGGKSAHVFFRDIFASQGISGNEATQLGKNLSMLVGDLQHSMAISMLTRLYTDNEHEPALVLKVIHYLEHTTLPALIEGESIDIILSKKKIEEVEFEDILQMITGKTASLIEFSAYSGALLGLDVLDNDHPHLKALSNFGHHLGVAFQLRDDINGLCKDTKDIGKPKSSDIKERKKTFPLWYAFNKADGKQKEVINQLLQKKVLNTADIKKITDLLIALGGINYTEDLLKKHVEFALLELDKLPNTVYKEYLKHFTSKLS